jgi:type II secretion system protein N
MTLPPFLRRLTTLPRALRRPKKRRLAYAAFALVAFVFALRQTFPVDAVGERLVLEAAARGWQLRMTDIQPAGFVGVRLAGVTLEAANGARIPLDELTAKLRLLPLVAGRRGIDFDARLFEGAVRGTAEESAASRRLVAHVDKVDLGRAAAMRRLVGVDLAGAISGDVDLAIDLKEPARSSGRVDLGVEQAAIQGGEVPVAAMGGAPLTLPRIGLGTVTAKAEVKDGKATFGTLTAKGDDVEVEGNGLSFTVQPRLEQAPLSGQARVRFAEALWQKNGAGAMRGVIELALAQGKGRDGSYGFQLFGTLGRPQARPTPPGP